MSSTVEPFTPGRGVEVTRPGVTVTDFLLLLMAFIWGVNIAVVKYGTLALSPLAYNGVRVAIAAVALLLVAGVMRNTWPSRRDTIALLLLGVLGNGLYQLFFIEGVAHTRAGNAALVLAATPAFVALGGWIARIERIRARGVLGIAVSFAGIAVVIFGAATPIGVGRSTLLGDALVLGG